MVDLVNLCEYLKISVSYLVTGKNESDLSFSPYTKEEDFLIQCIRSFSNQLRFQITGVISSLHTGNNLIN